MRISGLVILVALAGVGTSFGQSDTPARGDATPSAPLADHHQHVFSAELAELISTTTPVAKATVRTARALIAQLDAAGIRKAVVLSAAYIYEQPSRKVADAPARVRRENDWTSREVAQFPDRLVGFCSLNPLKDYAIDELARCARDPHLRKGLKLHFGNSVVDYRDRAHVEQLRRVFRAANGYGMAIVVHLRASVTQNLPYGRDEARVFLEDLLTAAPDVVVQVAHLAGAGSWEEEGTQQAFAALAEAVANGDPRTRRLYFDVTALGAPATPETARHWAAMVRRAGLDRIVFGSDATLRDLTPGGAWSALRTLLPLTDDEFHAIATNGLPYMR
jgi:predicted TIM-barrel fold metal-dependent hydrolase